MSQLLVFAFVFLAHANDHGNSTHDAALKDTQRLLKNKQLRDEKIKNNPNSQMVDEQVHSLGGNTKNAEGIYSLSADVMEELVKMTGGDADKMQQLLLMAKDNPKAFYESLSPTTRTKIKSMSQDIEHSPTVKKQNGK